ncbi:MAG TPA: SDR family NAD(P)-dependent oxidoreductase [Bacteroidia bacterium]|nr:SDR family NAD(P)-dependent oxidoreductase [Bacteroidia bacterium]
MKTVIVTGANSGLGLFTSLYLLDLEYKVILACRNVEKAKNAIESTSEFKNKKNYVIRNLDLGDFDSIRRFVHEIPENENIYGLDCNAGLSYSGGFRYTKNAIEETFGTNYLGHFLLTNLILEKFKPQKIVFISSGLHDQKNKSPFAPAVFREIIELAYPKINSDSSLKKQCEEFYATSKLCLLLFTYELDRRLKAKGLPVKTLVNAINPGLMLTTNLGRTYKPGEKIYRKLLDLFFKIIGLSDNPKASAKSVVRLIHTIETSGQYYDKDKAIQSSTDSYDAQKAKTLWEGSEKIIGSKFLT